jgi:hypothetical protein
MRKGIAQGEFRVADIDYTVKIIRSSLLMSQIWKHSFAACEPASLDMRRFFRGSRAVADCRPQSECLSWSSTMSITENRRLVAIVRSWSRGPIGIPRSNRSPTG